MVWKKYPMQKKHPGLWYNLEEIPLFSQRWMTMLANKRTGKPVTYTLTQFIVECRERCPDADTALVREIAEELWKEYDPDGQPGPVIP